LLLENWSEQTFIKEQHRYCPLLSELNPIEQSWSSVNSKVKRNKFLEKESLIARISIYLNIFFGMMGRGSIEEGSKCDINIHMERKCSSFFVKWVFKVNLVVGDALSKTPA
jgi:hypothetical protein